LRGTCSGKISADELDGGREASVQIIFFLGRGVKNTAKQFLETMGWTDTFYSLHCQLLDLVLYAGIKIFNFSPTSQ